MQVKLKCMSHTPLRGKNDPDISIVEQVNSVIEQASAEVAAFDPELIIVFAPDHYNGLFYDLMPSFVVAAGANSIGDYGTLKGPLNVPSDEAIALTEYLLNNDMDAALSYRLQVDHGCVQSLEELTHSITKYPVIPIIINSVAPPFSSYRRIQRLGKVVGDFIKTLNKRVLIIGSGGLSHEPPVPVLNSCPEEVREVLIAGRNPSPEARAAREARTIAAGKIYGTELCAQTPLNAEWDNAFMQLLIEGRLSDIDAFDIDTISQTAGRSAHEVRTWVAAFAALAANGEYAARTDFYRPINEWIAGYGVMSAELKN